MGRSLCVANQKGGVGKTTTALNLAGALAKAGCQTLLVDLDPQCNATTGLGRQPVTSHPLVSGTPIRQGVVATDIPGLDLLPGSRTFRDVETLTKDDAVQAAQLREHLTRGFSTYDYVLIDCPPSLGPLTKTALASSDEVLMPIQCEFFAMEGLTQMIATIGQIMQQAGHALRFGGIVLTMYDHTPGTDAGGGSGSKGIFWRNRVSHRNSARRGRFGSPQPRPDGHRLRAPLARHSGVR